MLALLAQAKELAEIRDANGNVLGFFAPLSLPHAQEYAKAASQVDPTQIPKSGKRGNSRDAQLKWYWTGSGRWGRLALAIGNLSKLAYNFNAPRSG